MVQPIYASTIPAVEARKRGRRPNRSIKREKVTETIRDRMVCPPLSCRIHLSALLFVRGKERKEKGTMGGSAVAASSYKDLVRLLVNTSTLIYLVGVV